MDHYRERPSVLVILSDVNAVGHDRFDVERCVPALLLDVHDTF